MQLFSEIFTSFESYRSLTAASINMGAQGDFEGKVQVSGSFSAEHQKVKVTQINTRSLTTRVQLRHNFYTAMQEPDTPLTPGFRNRLLDIVYELESGNTLMAQYLADMIIADYGTHYTTSVDAGGIYASLDFIRSDENSMSDSQMNSLKRDSAVNFENVAGFNQSIGVTRSVNSSKEYSKNLTDSCFMTEGGPALGPKAPVDEWVQGIVKNLVAIDRIGAPLFYAVSRDTLGSIKIQQANQVRQMIREAVERYYKANTIIGCMRRSSRNFNMMANVPSDDCEAPRYNYTFGGVFQSCSGDEQLCNEVKVVNPMTGEYTCPVGFQAVPLWSRVFKCKHSYAAPSDCAKYDLFWCASQRMPQENRLRTYLFGGVFNNLMSNPLTGTQSCPPNYFPLKMGASGLKVCLSRDFELGQEHSFEFGGFFSCKSGNPYALPPAHLSLPNTFSNYLHNGLPQAWPQQCPEGFAQHMADIDGNCEIMYCLRNKVFRKAQTSYVARPPFVKIPVNFRSYYSSTPNTIVQSMTTAREIWRRVPVTNTWSWSGVPQGASVELKNELHAMRTAKDEDKGETGTQNTPLASILAPIGVALCVALAVAVLVAMRNRRRGSATLGAANPNFQGNSDTGLNAETNETTGV